MAHPVDQFIGRARPLGHHQGRCDGKQADHPGAAVTVLHGRLVGAQWEVRVVQARRVVLVGDFDMGAEIGDLFHGHLPGGVDQDIGAFDGRLDDGGIAPLVDLLGIVRPQDGHAVPAGREGCGDPGDSLLVDQVVAAVEPIFVGEDQDFFAGIVHADAVVDHVGQEFPCFLWNANLSCHNYFLLQKELMP